MRMNLHSYNRRAKEHSTKLDKLQATIGEMKGGASTEITSGTGPSLDTSALT